MLTRLGVKRRQLGSERRPAYEFPPLPELRAAVERELRVDCQPEHTEQGPDPDGDAAREAARAEAARAKEEAGKAIRVEAKEAVKDAFKEVIESRTLFVGVQGRPVSPRVDVRRSANGQWPAHSRPRP
jgi:hypothetical protein